MSLTSRQPAPTPIDELASEAVLGKSRDPATSFGPDSLVVTALGKILDVHEDTARTESWTILLSVVQARRDDHVGDKRPFLAVYHLLGLGQYPDDWNIAREAAAKASVQIKTDKGERFNVESVNDRRVLAGHLGGYGNSRGSLTAGSNTLRGVCATLFEAMRVQAKAQAAADTDSPTEATPSDSNPNVGTSNGSSGFTRRVAIAAGVGATGVAALTGIGYSRFHHLDDNSFVEVVGSTNLYTRIPLVLRDKFLASGPPRWDGCAALEHIPKDWDAVAEEREILLVVRPRRPDLVMSGFFVTRSAQTPVDPRVGITCEGGGNGAPAGFHVTSSADGVHVKAFGAGVVNGRMQLALDNVGQTYKIAAWFRSETAQTTEWEGAFVFQYGKNGEKRFHLPVGPIRSVGGIASADLYESKDGLWVNAGKYGHS